jgi:hypothetical protein
MLPWGLSNLETEIQSVRDSETCRTGGVGKMFFRIWHPVPGFLVSEAVQKAILEDPAEPCPGTLRGTDSPVSLGEIFFCAKMIGFDLPQLPGRQSLVELSQGNFHLGPVTRCLG